MDDNFDGEDLKRMILKMANSRMTILICFMKPRRRIHRTGNMIWIGKTSPFLGGMSEEIAEEERERHRLETEK